MAAMSTRTALSITERELKMDDRRGPQMSVPRLHSLILTVQTLN